ncbi:hypothetical protein [uncultured Brevibacillus sp.]|uniref:hypothetical protein n=1 Tax=uncultured Brevibacillus sp. TaxID=169970 RepID=UPI00259643A6|nr:hypothetical protein [uncultured Brevibacillus sp.]
MVTLKPMTEEYFDQYLMNAIEDYAKDKVTYLAEVHSILKAMTSLSSPNSCICL